MPAQRRRAHALGGPRHGCLREMSYRTITNSIRSQCRFKINNSTPPQIMRKAAVQHGRGSAAATRGTTCCRCARWRKRPASRRRLPSRTLVVSDEQGSRSGKVDEVEVARKGKTMLNSAARTPPESPRQRIHNRPQRSAKPESSET